MNLLRSSSSSSPAPLGTALHQSQLLLAIVPSSCKHIFCSTVVLGIVGVLIGMAVHRVMWLRKQRQNKATTTKLDRHETMRTGVDANVREVKV